MTELLLPALPIADPRALLGPGPPSSPPSARVRVFDLSRGESVDRDGPASFALDVALVVDGTLLDGLDLAALQVDGEVSLDDDEVFLTTLGTFSPTATLEIP